MLIIFKNAKVGARKSRALTAHANSLARPIAKLHPSQ